MGPTEPRSTVLSAADEAIIVEFRRRTLLPLDDVMGCLRDAIPKLSRSALHRCLQRHGISRLPANEEKASKRGSFAETTIGYDGIVAAYRRDLPQPMITLAQFWHAVAREVPRDGRLVAHPYRRWREIAADQPDWPIRVIGPPPTSGTRDSFTDLVLLAGCQRVPEVRAITDTAQRRRVCATVREDGSWIDGGEDDEVIVRRIVTEETGTIGVFGYSFLSGHGDAIAAARIEGVAPTTEAIASPQLPGRASALYLREEAEPAHCARVGRIPCRVRLRCGDGAWRLDAAAWPRAPRPRSAAARSGSSQGPGNLAALARRLVAWTLGTPEGGET
ncbi:substrate-binding domain-containing protein [Elioraea sp.]|uniref:substrate-binding domain-containing protein n=1 Tax=Elioraea sp. TaxID=2185103 RepID=UPI0038CF790F